MAAKEVDNVRAALGMKPRVVKQQPKERGILVGEGGARGRGVVVGEGEARGEGGKEGACGRGRGSGPQGAAWVRACGPDRGCR